jgi:hypothetical protein
VKRHHVCDSTLVVGLLSCQTGIVWPYVSPSRWDKSEECTNKTSTAEYYFFPNHSFSLSLWRAHVKQNRQPFPAYFSPTFGLSPVAGKVAVSPESHVTVSGYSYGLAQLAPQLHPIPMFSISYRSYTQPRIHLHLRIEREGRISLLAWRFHLIAQLSYQICKCTIDVHGAH